MCVCVCVSGASGRDLPSHWEAVKMFEWNSEDGEKQEKTENKVDTLAAHGGTLDLIFSLFWPHKPHVRSSQ